MHDSEKYSSGAQSFWKYLNVAAQWVRSNKHIKVSVAVAGGPLYNFGLCQTAEHKVQQVK